ncbi:MAG: sialidase family protein [Nitrospiraceae bacterium]
MVCRAKGRKSSVTAVGVLLALCWSVFSAEAADSPLTRGSRLTVLEGPTPISPPAAQFDATGHLHLVWFEKRGLVGLVKVAVVTPEQKQAPTPVPVNPDGAGPDAIHQSPGLAIGSDGLQYVTWSIANTTPGALFASDLHLVRSKDGGQTFEAPVRINDDTRPIPHTFEDVAVGTDGRVHLGWLDGRNKDRSGASIQCAQSTDQGVTVGANRQVDGMACPCCRPMVRVAPDGAVWMVWRKTFEGNVRDIVVARSTDGGATFSAPRLVSHDGWVFDACPHRGPSIGFDRTGRVYVGWYTEGTDEQPRLLVAYSEDQGQTFSSPVSLHTETTSVPDNLRMAVHPDGHVVTVWEEVTGVRKRVVARVSADRGRTFGPMVTLSTGAKAEHPTVAVHANGRVAIVWTEHAFPNNRIVLQWAGVAEGDADTKK